MLVDDAADARREGCADCREVSREAESWVCAPPARRKHPSIKPHRVRAYCLARAFMAELLSRLGLEYCRAEQASQFSREAACEGRPRPLLLI